MKGTAYVFYPTKEKEFRKVATIELDYTRDDTFGALAERVWMQMNRGSGRENEAALVDNRSMMVGDLVALHIAGGTFWTRCEVAGFSRIDSPIDSRQPLEILPTEPFATWYETWV